MVVSPSLAVRLDGEDIPFSFANEDYRLAALLPNDIEPGQHTIEIQFMNLFKNSVLNPRFTIEVREVAEDEDDAAPTDPHAPASQPIKD